MSTLADNRADAALFRALFETAPDAMIVVDPAGVMVLANPRVHQLFGYASGALIGCPVEVLLPGPLRELHVAHRMQYMSAPRVRPMGAEFQLTGVRADGTAFPVEVGLSPIDAGRGPLFAASIRDVSETQRARQALARGRYDAALADISRRLLISPHDDGAIADIPGILAEALDAPAVAILLPASSTIGMRLLTSGALDAALTRRLSSAAWSNELDEISLDKLDRGEVIELATSPDAPSANAVAAALPDRHGPAGYLLAWLAAVSDDRDRRHFVGAVANVLAAAIQRARSEEQLAHAQRLDALGQLTGGIAHDFNNLLTIISGNLQLLEMESGSRDVTDGRTASTIASALRAVERGSALTRKLLGFSRRQRLSPRPLRPELLLADLSDMLSRTLGEHIYVLADCPDHLPPVYADPGELEAALINLSLNARDAMEQGGRLNISARVAELPSEEDSPAGEYVVFTVSDTGQGMTPEVQARVFEPFFTTKDAGKGSGLGLSMVYGFVKQSHGRLTIDSRAGRGTRVEVALPIAPITPLSSPLTTISHSAGETVLVVEDEVEVRRIATSFLRSAGYGVVEAADPTAAREAFMAHPDIALLFTDIVLNGGASGVALARELQALRPSLKVLLTSGYDFGNLEADLVDEGQASREVLRKPYRRDTLVAAVQRLVAPP